MNLYLDARQAEPQVTLAPVQADLGRWLPNLDFNVLPGGRALCGARSDTARLDDLASSRRKVRTGQLLYRERETFEYIYAVRSGSFKSTLALLDDGEQVSGFYMTGELMGLDGMADGRHASSATALEDSEVAVIAWAQLTGAAFNNVNIHLMMSRLVSGEIVRQHGHLVLLSGLNSAQRLAAFLLSQSDHMKVRGYSSTEFHLKMSRADIGSYLGMKLETVSRTFSDFQHQGLLKVEKRHIVITDMEGLTQAYKSREVNV